MSMIDTLNYYIEQAEADLEGLSWDIREETNYEGETHDLMMNLALNLMLIWLTCLKTGISFILEL